MLRLEENRERYFCTRSSINMWILRYIKNICVCVYIHIGILNVCRYESYKVMFNAPRIEKDMYRIRISQLIGTICKIVLCLSVFVYVCTDQAEDNSTRDKLEENYSIYYIYIYMYMHTVSSPCVKTLIIGLNVRQRRPLFRTFTTIGEITFRPRSRRKERRKI